jgi:hypothetical protein
MLKAGGVTCTSGFAAPTMIRFMKLWAETVGDSSRTRGLRAKSVAGPGQPSA